MMDWVAEFGMFLAKLLVLAVVVGVMLALVARARSGGGGEGRAQVRLEELNERRQRRRRRLQLAASEPGARKRLVRRFRRDDKARKKNKNEGSETGLVGTVWVLDFHGDLKASTAPRLAEEVSAVLDVAEENDEVVIRLESPGGLVHAYGHAAAEMDRLRQAGLSTTVCVDKVAASGGYLMACCADRLRAAPFAVLGSIGVVAQVPNVHRLLKRHDVDVEVLTAGRYKRTLTVLGENTEEGREKFLADLANIHELFKRYVGERRPQLDLESVATGEAWHGLDALERGLIDELGTSEAYLNERMESARVIKLSIQRRRNFADRMTKVASTAVEKSVERGIEALDASTWQKR